MKSRLGLSLFGLTLTLLVIGVLSVYNASVIEAARDFGDKFHFARQQLLWSSLGLVVMLVTSRLPLSLIKKISLPLFVLTLLLMILVLIPGIGSQVQGARRWLVLGSIRLQPSELLKLSLVIYLAAWLEKPRQLLPFLMILSLVLILTMLQPDLGTAIILITTAFLIYYLAGAPLVQLFVLALGGIVSGLLLVLTSAYRKQRLLTFLDPTRDPLGASYHLNQILIALGSGGWTGLGLGRSRQKYQYLPEVTTDSIFAIIGEEIGFIGLVILLLLFGALILVAFRIARDAGNRFQSLLAGGVAGWIALQTLLNVAAMVALVPLTGVPLPLVSYGGSSLITLLAGIGLIINVSRHRPRV